MSFDREDTLRRAEGLLRQGRLDAAIAEYERAAAEQPRDWSLANTLGDVYVRAGRTEQAARQYGRVAEALLQEGFYAKAAAICKKLLKLKPDDEASQIRLGELSQKQGLLADARAYFSTVADRRRTRGDRAGAAEMVVRIGSIDPADFGARWAAARALLGTGDAVQAAASFRELYADLIGSGREAEGLDALREAVRLNPDDRDGRAALARGAIASGNLEEVRGLLDRDTAGRDPALLGKLLELEMAAGNPEDIRQMAAALLDADPGLADRVLELAWPATAHNPDAGYAVALVVADAAARGGQADRAVAVLEEVVERMPQRQIPALLRLIEVAVGGGLEDVMTAAQARLADAYLSAGQAVEGRAVAEDLLARAPWLPDHLQRVRRALVMLKISDPDTLIARRLGGETPFTTMERFPGEAAAAPEPHHGATDAQPTQGADGIAEVEQGHAVSGPAPQPQALPQDPETADAHAGEIDLTGALDERPAGGDDASAGRTGTLEQVFESIRQGLAGEAGVDHSGQHLTIARTYLEMGMPDAAIEPLRSACLSPQRRFEAASLLGRLFLDRGDLPQGIEWLERAAEAPAPDQAQAARLLYDLGRAVEDSGDTARALAIFLELQSEAGDYLDTAGRIERLSRVETGG